MPELTLLFKTTPAKIDQLVLDASVTESHTGEVEVTEHPVEQGANIADHARPKPDSVTIEGIVSNTPLSHAQATRITESQGVTFETTSLADAIAGQAGNAESALATLRDLKDNPRLVTIVTALHTYDSMILISLSVPRDARSGDALRFTATFRQVRLVSNKTTTQTVAKEPKAKKKVSTGKQVAKPLDEAEAEKRRSAAIRLFEFIAGKDL